MIVSQYNRTGFIILFCAISKCLGVNTTAVGKLFKVNQGFQNLDAGIAIVGSSESKDTCKVRVENGSVHYFRNRLKISRPDFIHFKVAFGTYHPKYTKETFLPFRWVWTYNTTQGLFPYLYWSTDFYVLSFGLLDAKTLGGDPFIVFNVSDNCHLKLGTRKTTELLVEQLAVLVSELSGDTDTITEYQGSYWCYLAEAPGFRNSLGYYMGLYFAYPTSSINYNCCFTFYNFTEFKYAYNCLDTQMNKWIQCTTLPYFLGILLFLYFPIILCQAAAKLLSRELTDCYEISCGSDRRGLNSTYDDDQNPASNLESESEWLYLDGKFPKTFTSLFASLFPNRYSVSISRLKRFVFVLIGPSIIFIQILIYNNKMPKSIAAMISRKIPVGFLALLGSTIQDMAGAFVPYFGGPIVLLASYYLLGILFLVLPRNIANIIENGLPTSHSELFVLGLTTNEIKQFSKINVSDNPGYTNAANLFLCSFYMLFSGEFWKRVYKVQISRLSHCFYNQSGFRKCLCFTFIPLYALVCIGELFISIIYFLIPLCGCVILLIRGAVKTTTDSLRTSRLFSNNDVLYMLLTHTFTAMIFSFVVAVLFIFYVYSFCLVFIQSFFVIFQILVYCYVAVIVFPAESFGYLYFGVALLYYIIRLIRGFGVKYLDLLNDIVEISLRMKPNENRITACICDGNVVLTNVQITEIKSVQVNNIVIPIAKNALRGIQNGQNDTTSRLNLRNDAYGIKKDLFDYVVKRHLPVSKEVLHVVLHVSMICLFLLVTITLTATFVIGPTTTRSDLMHVVFIVTVGALPRALEAGMLYSSEKRIQREIKLRQLEKTINQYWLEVSEQTDVGLHEVWTDQVLDRDL